MSILGWLSAGPDAASKVLDGAIKGVDALIYTEEEKAVARQKLSDQWIELQKTMGEETTVRSVTRRVLAILIIVPFIMLTLAAAIAFPFNLEYSKFLLELAQGQFGVLALGVSGFYFGPYMLSYLQKK